MNCSVPRCWCVEVSHHTATDRFFFSFPSWVEEGSQTKDRSSKLKIVVLCRVCPLFCVLLCASVCNCVVCVWLKILQVSGPPRLIWCVKFKNSDSLRKKKSLDVAFLSISKEIYWFSFAYHCPRQLCFWCWENVWKLVEALAKTMPRNRKF